MQDDALATDLRVVDARNAQQLCLAGAGQRGGDDPAGGEVADFGGGPVGDHPAVADQHHSVGVRVGLLQVVGGKQDRAPVLGVGSDGVPEVSAASDVHAGGRFIQDQQVGVGQQRHGKAQPLLLASRALGDAPVGDRGDARALQYLVHGPGVREQAPRQFQRLRDGKVSEQPPVCITAEIRPEEMAWSGVPPKISTVPEVGLPRPSMMSMVVVFPAPLGPRNATTSPGWIVSVMPSTARTDPKFLCTLSNATAGEGV